MQDKIAITDGIWPNVDHLLAPEVVAQLAAQAAEADREGRMSETGLALLREHKWPGLAVPTKFGGLGANLLECCAVQRKLGGADPGLSIACTMHLGSVGVWNEHYVKQPDMTWVFMEAVAKRSLIVASAVAEPSLGGSVNRSTLRARRVEGGWEVTGRKGPLSFAASADLITLQFQSEPDGETPSKVLVALVPRSLPGISSERSWNTMGMRGSGSDTLVLEHCMIPDPMVVFQGEPGAAADGDLVAGIVWFCLVITSSYLGLAETALGVTRETLGRSRIAHLDAARAELPSFQAIVGQHAAALLTLESACAGLARAMDAKQDPQGLLAAALGLKQHAIRVVPEALGAFAEACGGIAYARSSTLERLWRDAQAIRFHPPTPVPVAQYLGRRALGMAAALDLDEAAPGLRERGGA
ncbi:acyl-CoA dehydrogenase family protein [Massilia sp. BJB1822]|uniref:acyl-CoA dehydrogenase family protein n=1 Tax=Massilia sp. BJB1822 TaxID=2744470 RepID=UPI001593A38E|nr:acyl-CoA dehydrogenase family protein [Massilia sp. BJB1822]NVE00065.1 acyl-CoA/acyl-ACP dehydrogenase [Massilia sp. BJB1822]